MRKGKYEYLKDEYPEIVSMDQFYRICHISKRSAKYLLENDIVPHTDTGKKTWRYEIRLDDIITYLRRREQWGSMIPIGAVSSRPLSRKKYVSRQSFHHLISPDVDKEKEVREYFTFIYADYPDVLKTSEVAEITGLHKSTVLKVLKTGELQSLKINRDYMVPKPFLLDFVVTRRYLYSTSSSEQFAKVLGGYEIWKTVKS